jgi:Ni/Fe-hydrogenase subunit HybB-like protein
MEFEEHVLGKLSRGVAVLLTLYVGLKFWDLEARGYFGAMFEGTIASNLFLLEMALFIIPVFIAIGTAKSATQKTIVLQSACVVAGVIVNRLNVLFAGLYEAAHMSYIPSVTEFAVSFGIIAMGCLAYLFIVENFEVFEKDAENNPYVENQELGYTPKVVFEVESNQKVMH